MTRSIVGPQTVKNSSREKPPFPPVAAMMAATSFLIAASYSACWRPITSFEAASLSALSTESAVHSPVAAFLYFAKDSSTLKMSTRQQCERTRVHNSIHKYKHGTPRMTTRQQYERKRAQSCAVYGCRLVHLDAGASICRLVPGS